MKVLLITNDRQIAQDTLLCLKMRYEGIDHSLAENAATGIEFIEKEGADFVVLDSFLKDMDSEIAITRIRKFSNVPVIVLTIIGAYSDKARFLEAGADECITKPINCIECLSIVNALLRRNKNAGFNSEKVLALDDRLELNLERRELKISGANIHLTPTESNLLAILARNHGQVITYITLLEKVWGSNYLGDFVLLKEHIHNLRSKIELNPSVPQVIITDRGLGYKLVKRI